MSTACKCMRLCISLQHFEPINSAVWRLAVQSIQPEEWTRINKFHFRQDLLTSLLGRLLLRYAVTKFSKKWAVCRVHDFVVSSLSNLVCNLALTSHDAPPGGRRNRRLSFLFQFTDCEWRDVRLERTDRGKPYVATPVDVDFGMNVTHQGDYVLLATSCSPNVGVDVMKVELPKRQGSVDDYINFMAKQYSARELKRMRAQDDNDREKLRYFYRFWCLKESIIKATGTGIHQDLASLDFEAGDLLADFVRVSVRKSKLFESGQHQSDWTFEECMIDKEHCAAVCYKNTNLPEECAGKKNAIRFTDISLSEILDRAQIVNPLERDAEIEWLAFKNRKKKPM